MFYKYGTYKPVSSYLYNNTRNNFRSLVIAYSDCLKKKYYLLYSRIDAEI